MAGVQMHNKTSTQRPAETIPTRIQWINVKTSKNKEIAAFYEKVLGWKPVEWEMADHWIEIKAPGEEKKTNLSLQTISSLKFDVPVGQAGICMVVKDLTKFHEYVKDMEGLKVVRDPTQEPWGFAATYFSPDGTEITILEEWILDTLNTDAEHVEKLDKLEKQETKTGGQGVCFVELPASDFKRASKFYTETFGWTFTERDGKTFFVTNDATHSLGGKLTEREDRLQGGMFYINVQNMEEATLKIKANGGNMVKAWSPLPPTPAMEHHTAAFKDTEGNEWGVYHVEFKNKRKNPE